MIYKYTKCESVIAKIMADSNMSRKDIRISDIREWIFEAVEKIGAPVQYIVKESGADGVPIFKIEDHQIPIPEDLVSLTSIAYATNERGPWYPVRSETGDFREPKRDPQDVGKIVTPIYDEHNMVVEDVPDTVDIHSDINPPHQPMRYKLPTSQSQFYGIYLTKYIRRMVDMKHKEPTYFIKPGWIVFNKKEGYVKLSYKAIATDERGYPLIPDLASYQEAIYWYVMMKLSFPKFMQGKLGGAGVTSNARVYDYIRSQWAFYRGQAYGEAMMPTEGEIRSIKNEWNKLVPEWDSDDVFFKPVGRRQLNYNDYYYGY